MKFVLSPSIHIAPPSQYRSQSSEGSALLYVTLLLRNVVSLPTTVIAPPNGAVLYEKLPFSKRVFSPITYVEPPIRVAELFKETISVNTAPSPATAIAPPIIAVLLLEVRFITLQSEPIT